MAVVSDMRADAAEHQGPLGVWRIVTIALCVMLNVCDGLDAAAATLAAPLLIKFGGFSIADMAWVLTVSSAGMVLGAFVVAPIADRVGRRTVVLSCSAAASVAMLLISTTPPFELLLLLRFITGLTIGALMPSLSVVAVEISGGTRGNIALACVHLGFAIGAAIGAIVGASAASIGWQHIFFVAGLINLAVTAIAIPLFPESTAFLLTRQPKGALQRVNRIRARYGEPALDALPPIEPRADRAPIAVGRLFARGFLAVTILLWFACFARFCVGYFLNSWKNQMLVTAGMSIEAANLSGLASSLASALGVLTMGAIAAALGPARMTGVAFLLCFASLMCFSVIDTPLWLIVSSCITQFGVEMTFTGIMISAARFYPTDMRMTGVAWTVGFGRIGAIVGPYTGGLLMSMGVERGAYVPVYAGLALAGGIAIWTITRLTDRLNGRASQPA